MQIRTKTFGASRLVAAGLFTLFGAIAASIFAPGVTDYLANGEIVGPLRVVNSWEPGHRLLLAHVLVGISALLAVSYLRRLIDNTVVVLDHEGIEVRHALWVNRAMWRDFDTVSTSRFFGAKDVSILFLPGRDASGRKLSRKVRLPNPILGVDAKAVLMEALVLVAADQAMAPSPNTSTRGPGAPPMVGPRRAVFGKRQ
ncbi:hypothetical protein ASC89_18840 [Devosia sp. Root413D1]|uniref:hypothetical protein n=1 Tax=Devosia sp. Root413D1 TaxID=1736531 RepID=UPI0006FACA38|nr:hypothetical protein [Devosia sp. Root413D1]KQW77252.1 hypothetical protein ASC89_18840 [Devosia sp. Root413D1]